MTVSLSVVLPVRNAQAKLAEFAAGLLEILPELSADFELIVIDNGSTDATLDVAHEIELAYPQVRVVRHGWPVDLGGIVRTTLSQTDAEHILLCDEDCRLELRDLHKLWRSREDYDAVLASPASAGAVDEEAYGQRVKAWRLKLARPAAATPKENTPGYQLLRRRVLETLRWIARDRYELLAELSRHGFRWQVVEVRTSATAPLARQRDGSVRVDQQSAALAGPATRVTRRIKDFAWGE